MAPAPSACLPGEALDSAHTLPLSETTWDHHEFGVLQAPNSSLLQPLLWRAQVVTSCNSTREELIQEFCAGPPMEPCAFNWMGGCMHSRWKAVDWVKTYPTFKFGGTEGSKVCTIAFQKLLPLPRT